MDFWNFMDMLGSPARPSAIEKAVARLANAFDTLSFAKREDPGYMGKLEEAERKMRNA